MTATDLVILDGVSKYFGNHCVVNHISFRAGIGEVLGVMGPNGAGKTTTMRMIASFLRPSAGKILLDGSDVVEHSLATRKKLGYLPEGAPLWQDMSVINLMRFAARVRGLTKQHAKQAIDHAMHIADLEAVAHQPIATLSKGYRRRVGLAQAIFHDPPILVLDEPTDGLDPNQKHHVRSLIRNMAETKAIIISTHILEEVEPLCTRILIMHQGNILADETPASFSARSKYHNAVSVRLNASAAKRFIALGANISAIRDHELIVKKNAAHIIFFPHPGRNSANLAQEIRAIANEKKIALRALAIEAGRLDDVFHHMTTG